MRLRTIICLIIVAFVLVSILVFVGWCFSNETLWYEGSLRTDDTEPVSVTICVVRRNMDTLFSKMKGEITVRSGDGTILYTYLLEGPVHEPNQNGCYSVGIWRMGKYGAEGPSSYYFDKKEDHIVIDTDAEVIIAADEEFLGLLPLADFP